MGVGGREVEERWERVGEEEGVDDGFDGFVDKFDPMIERMASEEMLDGVKDARVEEGSDGVYEIEKIVGKRTHKRKVQYLVRWTGWSPKWNT